jgi:hypothetical protein
MEQEVASPNEGHQDWKIILTFRSNHLDGKIKSEKIWPTRYVNILKGSNSCCLYSKHAIMWIIYNITNTS